MSPKITLMENTGQSEYSTQNNLLGAQEIPETSVSCSRELHTHNREVGKPGLEKVHVCSLTSVELLLIPHSSRPLWILQLRSIPFPMDVAAILELCVCCREGLLVFPGHLASLAPETVVIKSLLGPLALASYWQPLTHKFNPFLLICVSPCGSDLPGKVSSSSGGTT